MGAVSMEQRAAGSGQRAVSKELKRKECEEGRRCWSHDGLVYLFGRAVQPWSSPPLNLEL
jgi:hypothetical protein